MKQVIILSIVKVIQYDIIIMHFSLQGLVTGSGLFCIDDRVGFYLAGIALGSYGTMCTLVFSDTLKYP